ncbi:MAG: hypothetical protein HKL81_10230, partial [Acidimicrobiaceae bacterium]|nr:hypothetical protein [Acidimicrobiaceae bacterium]
SIAFKNSSASVTAVANTPSTAEPAATAPASPNTSSTKSKTPAVTALSNPAPGATVGQQPASQVTSTPKATATTPAVAAPVVLPTVTSINLQSVSGSTSSVIWVFGTNLASVNEVSFGGVTSPVLHYFAAQGGIEVQTPLHVAGTVDVRLVSQAGMSPLTPADTLTFIEAASSNIGSAQLP